MGVAVGYSIRVPGVPPRALTSPSPVTRTLTPSSTPAGDIDEYTAAFNVIADPGHDAFRRGLNHPAFTPCGAHTLSHPRTGRDRSPSSYESHLYHYRWNNAKATMTYQVAHRYHDNVHMSPSVVTQSLFLATKTASSNVIVRS